jgi:hypothetical protein
MQVTLDWLQGRKTYAALAAGAIVIALNHYMVLYGYWPIDLIGLDPNNWLNDEYKLLLGATGRSAIAGVLAQLQATHASAIAAANIAQIQATPAQARQGSGGPPTKIISS